ncbi:MAG: efflux RND transporter periplasmic adaptor subunit [Marmoricola sp.]
MPSLPLLPRLRAVRRQWWFLGLVVVLAGVGGWLKLAPGSSSSATQSITATVATGTYKTTVSATGTITPKREADLSFTSAGTVTRVAVAAGDKVAKGDVLATIDDTALIAQRDAAQAQLTAARTQLAEDAGGSSAQVASDEAAVASASSALAQASDAVDDATLTAPFAGTVSAVDVAVGDQAGSSSGGNSPTADGSSSGSTPAVTVISPRSLQVDAEVSAADVTQLKKGMQAEITPTGGGAVVYGTVTDVGVIAAASDSGAAQFPVTVDVTGTPAGLYPGSSATVAITVKQATDVLAVPTQALHTSAGKTYVYTVDSKKKRTRTSVTVGTTYGAQTQVLSGLKAGDVVEVLAFTRPTGGGNDRTGTRGEGGAFPGGGSFPGGGTFTGGGNGPTLSFGGK